MDVFPCETVCLYINIDANIKNYNCSNLHNDSLLYLSAVNLTLCLNNEQSNVSSSNSNYHHAQTIYLFWKQSFHSFFISFQCIANILSLTDIK